MRVEYRLYWRAGMRRRGRVLFANNDWCGQAARRMSSRNVRVCRSVLHTGLLHPKCRLLLEKLFTATRHQSCPDDLYRKHRLGRKTRTRSGYLPIQKRLKISVRTATSTFSPVTSPIARSAVRTSVRHQIDRIAIRPGFDPLPDCSFQLDNVILSWKSCI